MRMDIPPADDGHRVSLFDVLDFLDDAMVAIVFFVLCVFACLAVSSLSARAGAELPRVRLARSLRGDQIAKAVTNAPANAKISVPIILPREWKQSIAYAAGDACTLSGAVYVCVQSHTSLSNWQPSAVPALWRLVRAAGERPGQTPAWRQPLGAHDAYRKGDRVTHNGKTWTSTIDANVWAPGVYGWAAD